MQAGLDAAGRGAPAFTMMVGAVRSLTLGDQAGAVLGHSAAWFVVAAVLWAVAIAAVFATLANASVRPVVTVS